MYTGILEVEMKSIDENDTQLADGANSRKWGGVDGNGMGKRQVCSPAFPFSTPSEHVRGTLYCSVEAGHGHMTCWSMKQEQK